MFSSIAYGLRFIIFGIYQSLPVGLVVASQALHGVCAAAFFAASFIYMDRVADDDVRHSAQTIFSIVLFGIGPILAGKMLPVFTGMATSNGEFSFTTFWFILSVIGLASTVIFAWLFRDEVKGEEAAQA